MSIYKLIVDGVTEDVLSPVILKEKEAYLRGLRKDYTIEYPDGYKVHCELIDVKQRLLDSIEELER